MLFAYGTGMTGQNPFANDEKVEITSDKTVQPIRGFVKGQKRLRQLRVCHISHPRCQTWNRQQPFKTRGYKSNDPSTNRIRIGLEPHLILEMDQHDGKEDFVWGEGYGNGSKADEERCNMMIVV